MVFKSRNESSPASDLPVRRYHVVGVDARCESLFHSMMRLVANKAGSHWVHDAEAHDLLVEGAATDSSGPAAALRRSFASFTRGGGDDCAMLRLDGMLETLEDVERDLATSRSAPAAPVPTAADTAQAMKLTRWPNASLLAGQPVFPKLATLMLSRPMTIGELARRSGLDESVCADFVDSLREAGLVEVQRSSAPAAAPERSGGSRGLFAMIRDRLGLGEVFS